MTRIQGLFLGLTAALLFSFAAQAQNDASPADMDFTPPPKPAPKKKAADKKADAKAEDKKADAQATEKKADAKADEKAADKKADAKATEKKAEVKADTKAAEKKADAKATEKKAEVKADEKATSKKDERAAAKKADAKATEKKADAKADETAAEKKADAKAVEKKVDAKADETAAAKKADASAAEQKAEVKADAPPAPAPAPAPTSTAAAPTAVEVNVSDKDSAVPAHQAHPFDADMPKPKGTLVELKIGDKGSTAYVAKPAGEAKGTILVIHEYWGLNDWIKHEADELAALGYLALAVDLYKGSVASTPEEAGKLMGDLDNAWAAQVEHAGIQWLKATEPKHDVGVIGWCMGGGQSLQASINDAQDVTATVIYYGMPVSDPHVLARLKGGAVLGLYAKKDGWITPDKVDAFDKALAAAGVDHALTSYDADHAFANPSGGKHNPEAAKDAWKKTKAFLASHLN